MGMSVDSYIVFGISFEEEYEFPWDYQDGMEDWWLNHKGFVPSEYPYTEDGEVKEGLSEEEYQRQFDVYYEEKKRFLASNPVPLATVECGSGEYYQSVLILPHLCMVDSASSNPQKFDPQDLKVSVSDIEKLKALAKEFLDCEDEPDYYLLSRYW